MEYNLASNPKKSRLNRFRAELNKYGINYNA